MNTSLAEMWLYSRRKWCSVNQPYLKPARSAASAIVTSSSNRSCSSVPTGTWPEWKIPNSITPPRLVRASGRVPVPASRAPDHGLQLAVRMEPEAAAVASDAGLLRAAERRLLVALHGVDADVAGAHPAADRHRPARVGAEHVVVETELGPVGERDALVVVVEGQRHDHR